MTVMFLITCMILGVFTILGCKNGLFKTVVSLGVIIASLFLANWGSGYVDNALHNLTSIDESIEFGVVEALLDSVEGHINAKAEQITVIEESSMPEVIKKMLIDNNNPDTYEELAVTGFFEYIGQLVSSIAIRGLAYLICFGVFFLFLTFVVQALNLVLDFPILGWVDKCGGLLLGLAKGLVLVWLMNLIITICISMEWASQAYAQIADNAFLSFLYDNNILMKIVLNISDILFK